MYDFANLLFSGPCNAHCYFCIGRQVEARLSPDNLDVFPPRGLQALIDQIVQHGIRQVVLSGTNTDPQRYRHEDRLLDLLRRQLPPGVQISLHTNGLLALRKLAVFNQYDRVTLSFPSFTPAVYRAMMGLPRPPDLPAILAAANVPVKLSCLLDAHNLPELPAYLDRCQALGVRRLVLRKLYGDPRPWSALLDPAALGLAPRPAYRGNPVYAYGEMEVTLWDFERTASRSLNLFASGRLSPHYLLTQADPEAGL
jgi:MoaA/NifB/PqqE/SkfB family radical SAM enzyme